MIREIEIGNYQSLRKLRVRLGRFTVVTGRTGTGKSALIRAVELLTFNAKGTSYITRGEKTVAVIMKGEDEGQDGPYLWDVAVRRGGQDRYDIRKGSDGMKTFTKLAGKVPEAVKGLLRLGEVNFAGQFATPYLLDSTGSEVARVLGKLTNVTLLYRAAQEANRRRLAVSAELKAREADLGVLEQQIAAYATLPAEKTAVEEAEAALERMQVLTGTKERLERLLLILHQSWKTHGDVTSRVFPEPPPLDLLEQFVAYRDRLVVVTASFRLAGATLSAAQQAENLISAAESKVQQELTEYTSQWDVCPTCGQPVLKEHDH